MGGRQLRELCFGNSSWIWELSLALGTLLWELCKGWIWELSWIWELARQLRELIRKPGFGNSGKGPGFGNSSRNLDLGTEKTELDSGTLPGSWIRELPDMDSETGRPGIGNLHLYSGTNGHWALRTLNRGWGGVVWKGRGRAGAGAGLGWGGCGGVE